MPTTLDLIRDFHPCSDAAAYAAKHADPAEAWESCERGDWLLWLAARAGVDRRDLVRASCAVARRALQHVPEGESRPRIAIETAEAWVRREVTIAAVRDAAAAADDAAAAAADVRDDAAAATYASAAAAASADAAAAYASAAAYAAADASAAAYAAADAAADASAAAYAAADAAVDAAYAAYANSLRYAAAIVREYFPFHAILARLGSRQ
jgi:hypothetical protein